VCDRIGIFAAGKLVGQGTVGELAATFGDGAATIEVGLELTGTDDLERATRVFDALEGVESVAAPTDATSPWRLVVRPAGAEARVRREVLLAAVEHDLHLTAIRPIVPSLDDICTAPRSSGEAA
jgi:ABC-type uncharacterized transport system ATPase subunit